MSVSTYEPDSSQIIHESKIDFKQRIIVKTIHIMQGDRSLPIIAVRLQMDGYPYTLPSNAEVKLRWGKRDHTFVYKKVLGCDTTRQIVYFDIDEQMSYFNGPHNPILELTIDGKVVGSSYIPFEVDRNPIQQGDIESQIKFTDLDATMNELHKAEQNASAYASEAKEIITKLPLLETELEQQLNNTSSSAINDINTKKDSSIQDINDIKDQVILDINTARDNSIEDVKNTSQEVLNNKQDLLTENTDIQIKNLTAKNLDLSYTAEDGKTRKNGKVKSDLTPYSDSTQNLGSNTKQWKDIYVKEINAGVEINIKTGRLKADGKPEYITIVRKSNGENMFGYLRILDTDGRTIYYGGEGSMRFAENTIAVMTNDLGSTSPMLDISDQIALNALTIISPFSPNAVNSIPKVKFGGSEEVTDGGTGIEVMLAVKTEEYGVVPFAIDKNGNMYYKGEMLDRINHLYEHTIYMNVDGGNSINDKIQSTYIEFNILSSNPTPVIFDDNRYSDRDYFFGKIRELVNLTGNTTYQTINIYCDDASFTSYGESFIPYNVRIFANELDVGMSADFRSQDDQSYQFYVRARDKNEVYPINVWSFYDTVRKIF